MQKFIFNGIFLFKIQNEFVYKLNFLTIPPRLPFPPHRRTLELLQSRATTSQTCTTESKEDDITRDVQELLSAPANGSNPANDLT